MVRPGVKLIIIALLAISTAPAQEIYYTCSYADSIAPSRLLFSKIDLNERRIICNTALSLTGLIVHRRPPIISSNRMSFRYVLSNYGLWGKNSTMADRSTLNYAIMDTNCSLIYSGSIANTRITSTSPTGIHWDSSFIYSVGRDDDETLYEGRFSLDSNRRLRLENRSTLDLRVDDFVQIDRFKYYKQLAPNNRQLYWDIIPDGLYVLKLDANENRVIDTILVDNAINRLYLFGFNENDSSVYVFYMNYNIIDPNSEYQKTSIDPSYAKIFSYNDFSLIDSINIPYPPLDSGYVLGTTGSVDKVGSYFVYFDLTQEDPNYFSPAMLFIFDTRTNETTWLRVGWR